MKIKAVALLAGLSAAAMLGVYADSFAQAPTAADAEAEAREAWRETIVRTSVPEEGCFHASYPDIAWTRTECSVAPNIAYLPRRGATSNTVGNGVDDVADIVTGLITESVGTFPTVTGVTGEKDDGANNYSLQLNSNFMKGTAVCSGHTGCQSWEQFVYSSGEESAFMQYWLLTYGKCPSGWNKSGDDCYMNSAAVSVPKIAITQLANLKLSGSAVIDGIDTLVFTTETEAYSTTGADSVTDLGTDWHESEFNVVGDGGGTEAKFNTGAEITVKIAVTSSVQGTPTCATDSGTTGETNNLTLGKCITAGGATPYIEFIEAN
jgi:hypothetical protein